MKKQLILILFLSISIVGFSQNGNFNRQFGVDGTAFLAQFLNFSGSGAGAQTYYFTHRKLGEKHNIRSGIGGNMNFSGGDSDTRFSMNINFRTGKEKFKDFAKRWRGFYGWDLKIGFGTNLTESSNVVSFNIGPSAVFGLQFRLNERLSLSTETSFDILGTGLFREDDNNYGISTAFRAPLALYLNYDFFKEEKKN